MICAQVAKRFPRCWWRLGRQDCEASVSIFLAICLRHPEHRLYDLLAKDDSDSAHSRYNAYLRRLVSYERAAECVSP
jgi:hypothetical protein